MLKLLLFCGPDKSSFCNEVLQGFQSYNKLLGEEEISIFDNADDLREEIELLMELERTRGDTYIIISLLDGFERGAISHKIVTSALGGLSDQPLLKIYLLNTKEYDTRFSTEGYFKQYTLNLLKHLPALNHDPDQLNHRPILLSNALERGAKLNQNDVGLQLFGILYSIQQDENEKLLSLLRGNANKSFPFLINSRVLICLNKYQTDDFLTKLKKQFLSVIISQNSRNEVLTFDSDHRREMIECNLNTNYQNYLGIPLKRSGVCDKLIRLFNPISTTKAFYDIVRRQTVRVKRPDWKETILLLRDRLNRQLQTMIVGMESLAAYDAKITNLRDAIFQNGKVLDDLGEKVKQYKGFTRFKNIHDLGAENLQYRIDWLRELRLYRNWLNWRNMRPGKPPYFFAALFSLLVTTAGLYLYFTNTLFSDFLGNWVMGISSCLLTGIATHFIFHRIYLFILEHSIQKQFMTFNGECEANFGLWLDQKKEIFRNMNAAKLLREQINVFDRFLTRLVVIREELEESLDFLDVLIKGKSLVAMILDDNTQINLPFDYETLEAPEPQIKTQNGMIVDVDINWKAYFIESLSSVMELQDGFSADQLNNTQMNTIYLQTLDSAKGTRRWLSPPIDAEEVDSNEALDIVGPTRIFENIPTVEASSLMAFENEGKLAVHLCLAGLRETQ